MCLARLLGLPLKETAFILRGTLGSGLTSETARRVATGQSRRPETQGPWPPCVRDPPPARTPVLARQNEKLPPESRLKGAASTLRTQSSPFQGQQVEARTSDGLPWSCPRSSPGRDATARANLTRFIGRFHLLLRPQAQDPPPPNPQYGVRLPPHPRHRVRLPPHPQDRVGMAGQLDRFSVTGLHEGLR